MIDRQYYRHVEDDAKEPYHYTGCGLDDVYLLSGYELHSGPHGTGVSIKNLDDLHVAIGLYLVDRKKSLNSKEIKFLRRQMNMTQSDLGRYLGYSAQQIARWEKDQMEITEPANRLLRVLFRDHCKRSVGLKALLKRLDRTDDSSPPRKLFRSTEEGWRYAA